MQIRLANQDDLPRIREIYNYAILNLTATFDEEPKNFEEYEQWFELHQTPVYPLLIAEKDTIVRGWASISPFISKAAARFSGESSVYIHPDYHGLGTAFALLTELIGQAKDLGYRSLFALITSDNAASVKLHQKHGYTIAGKYDNVACKFDRWLDLLILQKKIY